MSKSSYRETDDRRGEPEDIPEAPTGQVNDDSYVTEGSNKREPIDVVSDEADIEDPVRPEDADSDQQLGMPFFSSPSFSLKPLKGI
jgi:hypothetical protein